MLEVSLKNKTQVIVLVVLLAILAGACWYCYRYYNPVGETVVNHAGQAKGGPAPGDAAAMQKFKAYQQQHSH